MQSKHFSVVIYLIAVPIITFSILVSWNTLGWSLQRFIWNTPPELKVITKAFVGDNYVVVSYEDVFDFYGLTPASQYLKHLDYAFSFKEGSSFIAASITDTGNINSIFFEGKQSNGWITMENIRKGFRTIPENVCMYGYSGVRILYPNTEISDFVFRDIPYKIQIESNEGITSSCFDKENTAS